MNNEKSFQGKAMREDTSGLPQISAETFNNDTGYNSDSEDSILGRSVCSGVDGATMGNNGLKTALFIGDDSSVSGSSNPNMAPALELIGANGETSLQVPSLSDLARDVVSESTPSQSRMAFLKDFIAFAATAECNSPNALRENLPSLRSDIDKLEDSYCRLSRQNKDQQRIISELTGEIARLRSIEDDASSFHGDEISPNARFGDDALIPRSRVGQTVSGVSSVAHANHNVNNVSSSSINYNLAASREDDEISQLRSETMSLRIQLGHAKNELSDRAEEAEVFRDETLRLAAMIEHGRFGSAEATREVENLHQNLKFVQLQLASANLELEKLKKGESSKELEFARTVAGLEGQRDALQIQLQTVNDEARELRDVLVKVRTEIANVRSEASVSLARARDEYESKLEVFQKENMELRESSLARDSEVSALKKSLSKVTEELSHSFVELENYKADLEAQKQISQDLKGLLEQNEKNASVSCELETAAKLQAELEARVLALEASETANLRELETAANIRTELEARIVEFENSNVEMLSLHARVAQLEASETANIRELEIAANIRTELEARIAKFENSNVEMLSLHARVAQLEASETANIRELETAANIRTELEARIAEFENSNVEMLSLHARVAQLEASETANLRELETAANIRTELEKHIVELENVASLDVQELEARIAELETAESANLHELEVAANIREELENRIVELLTAETANLRELESAVAENDRVLETASQMRIELEEQVKTLSDSLNANVCELKEKSSKIEMLTEENKELRSRVADLEEADSANDRELEFATSVRESLELRISELEQGSEKMNDMYSALSVEYNNVLLKLTEATEDRDALFETLDEMEPAHKNLTETHQKLSEDHQKLLKMHQATQEDLSTLRTEFEKLTELHQKLTAKNQQLEQEGQEFLNEYLPLEEDLKKAQAELANAKCEAGKYKELLHVHQDLLQTHQDLMQKELSQSAALSELQREMEALQKDKETTVAQAKPVMNTHVRTFAALAVDGLPNCPGCGELGAALETAMARVDALEASSHQNLIKNDKKDSSRNKTKKNAVDEGDELDWLRRMQFGDSDSESETEAKQEETPSYACAQCCSLRAERDATQSLVGAMRETELQLRIEIEKLVRAANVPPKASPKCDRCVELSGIVDILSNEKKELESRSCSTCSQLRDELERERLAWETAIAESEARSQAAEKLATEGRDALNLLVSRCSETDEILMTLRGRLETDQRANGELRERTRSLEDSIAGLNSTRDALETQVSLLIKDKNTRERQIESLVAQLKSATGREPMDVHCEPKNCEQGFNENESRRRAGAVVSITSLATRRREEAEAKMKQETRHSETLRIAPRPELVGRSVRRPTETISASTVAVPVSSPVRNVTNGGRSGLASPSPLLRGSENRPTTTGGNVRTRQGFAIPTTSTTTVTSPCEGFDQSTNIRAGAFAAGCELSHASSSRYYRPMQEGPSTSSPPAPATVPLSTSVPSKASKSVPRPSANYTANSNANDHTGSEVPSLTLIPRLFGSAIELGNHSPNLDLLSGRGSRGASRFSPCEPVSSSVRPSTRMERENSYLTSYSNNNINQSSLSNTLYQNNAAMINLNNNTTTVTNNLSSYAPTPAMNLTTSTTNKLSENVIEKQSFKNTEHQPVIVQQFADVPTPNSLGPGRAQSVNSANLTSSISRTLFASDDVPLSMKERLASSNNGNMFSWSSKISDVRPRSTPFGIDEANMPTKLQFKNQFLNGQQTERAFTPQRGGEQPNVVVDSSRWSGRNHSGVTNDTSISRYLN